MHLHYSNLTIPARGDTAGRLQSESALQGAQHVCQRHKLLNIEGVLPGVFLSQPVTEVESEGSLINMQSSFLACLCVCVFACVYVRACSYVRVCWAYL